MATTTLVEAGANRLRYLIVGETTFSETATITTIGGATPDTLTDSAAGTIKNLSKVVANGFGQFAAGVQTQAKSRALWLSDWGGADPGSEATQPTAICRLTARSGASAVFADVGSVDANIDGGGNPTIVVTVVNAAALYLDVEVPGTIGD